ncbi:MAG: BatD family protein [Steroidobacteraceae bacterium]
MKTICRSSGWLVAVIAEFLLAAAPAVADVPLLYATIEPAQISMGESAQYTITNLGSEAESIKLPVVAGLDFQIVRRSHQLEFVNGMALPAVLIVARVTPQLAGIFSIPGITPKSPPLVLQVNEARAAGSFFVPRNTGPQVVPPILTGAAMPNGIHLTEDGSAYVRLSVPKREVYVGESVPVEIDVGMRSGFVSSLNGLPKLTGDDFTLNNLSRSPERAEKILAGERFVVFTWRSDLEVVKPGTFSLSAEVPLTVKVRTQSRKDSLLDDEFGDPFLRNFFGPTVPKDINAASPALQLTVLALPTEGRPADFHGAVGTFKIASDISPAAAEAGEPLTLRMHVTGAGNFDRVDSAMLDHLDNWKTYPPKSSFSPGDANGRKGEKTFEQPLIASKSGAQILPGLAFSYFDPTARRYETARSAPLSVMISPSAADSTLTAQQVSASAAMAPENKFSSGLRPDHVVAGALAGSLVPLYLQPRFLTIPSVLALAFAGGWIGAGRRTNRDRNMPLRKRRLSKAAKRALAQMEAAARSGDPGRFFSCARSTLQQTLAARWQLAADRVTSAEVDSRIGGEGHDIPLLFALADEAQYSGHDLHTTDFARWMQIVRQQLLADAP